MGEAFISAKKERFEHGRDAAVERDFKTENLLSLLPDVLTKEYRCILTSTEHAPAVGDAVLIASLEAAQVDVLLRNVIIGYVQPKDAAKLKSSLTRSGVQMLVATVRSVGKLSRTFTIVVDDGGE